MSKLGNSPPIEEPASIKRNIHLQSMRAALEDPAVTSDRISLQNACAQLDEAQEIRGYAVRAVGGTRTKAGVKASPRTPRSASGLNDSELNSSA